MRWTMRMALIGALGFGLLGCSDYDSRPSGDLDGDGHLTDQDVALLEALIDQGGDDAAGDLNGDGQVDADDLALLRQRVCEANGGELGDDGRCCTTADDGTVCCDSELDGDFEHCTPPELDCEADADCDPLNCPARCIDGRCRCEDVCADDEDCQMLDCPAFCDDSGRCQCKIPCAANDDCAFISRCRSVCGDDGHCICDDDCLRAGEEFFPEDPDAEPNCCPGLEPIELADYHNGQCAYLDCICYVCAACGDGICGAGENPCNCEQDCGQCRPGDERLYTCPDGSQVPWCHCSEDGQWACIRSPENACEHLECHPGNERTYLCPDGEEVFWCECDHQGVWQCIDSPESQCSTQECAPGDERFYTCPDGSQVPWCICDEDAIWMCINSPENACADPCAGVVCDDGFHCEDGSCVPDQCLGEGEQFEDFDTAGKCCDGLVPIPVAVAENGTCSSPNCPCYVCARCGTDGGVCSTGENRCNCPQDCVGADHCSAEDCLNIEREYMVDGDCPGLPLGQMDRIAQGVGCAAMDARGEGDCDLHLGVIWNGEACVNISGCSCVGADCQALFESLEACRDAYAPCFDLPSCAAMDARGEGLCDMELGILWDGRECRSISGCECVGSDCDRLYHEPAECREAHAHCLAHPCSLLLPGPLGEVLGRSGCIDHHIIHTLAGCSGAAHQTGVSITIHLTCPMIEDDGSEGSCEVFLDDLID